MSNIKSLDKLRKLKGEVVDYRWGVDFDRAVDDLEAEIAERYIELPVDADGVPIHVGDRVAQSDGEQKEVQGVGRGSYYVERIDPWDFEQRWPSCCHHVKPRTIEDVLRDCCNEWNEHCGDDWESGVYVKYAEEIREMMA